MELLSVSPATSKPVGTWKLTRPQFQDFLYALGKEGGSDAAHQLHAEIKSHLKRLYPDASVDDWSIVVQVVLNLHGLAAKLHGCGVVSSPNELAEFGRAFGLAQPMFSFIDVGSGKERADHKVFSPASTFIETRANRWFDRFERPCACSFPTPNASTSSSDLATTTVTWSFWRATNATMLRSLL